MIETKYQFSATNDKLIERIFEDEHVGINHMILPQGTALPEHFANSHVYMLVMRGTVSLQLDEQERHDYPTGSIINIPWKTKMNVSNQHPEVLEIFVLKAPSPHTMQG